MSGREKLIYIPGAVDRHLPIPGSCDQVCLGPREWWKMAMARCGPGNLVCIMVSINRALPSLGDECLAPRRALFPLEVNLGRPGRAAARSLGRISPRTGVGEPSPPSIFHAFYFKWLVTNRDSSFNQRGIGYFDQSFNLQIFDSIICNRSWNNPSIFSLRFHIEKRIVSCKQSPS